LFVISSARNGKFFRPGKFLRPENANDDDDDDDDSSEDEEDQPATRVVQRGGGKSLSRPAPPVEESSDEDDDDDDEDDEDEEEKQEQPTRVVQRGGGKSLANRPPPASANLSSDDDDDDDDDDEEEEEETTRKRKKGDGGAGSKKSKRSKASSFFDEEAEDDEEDEDEPYGTHHDPDDRVKKHYTEEDIRKEQMDEDAQEIIRQQDRRRAQAGYRFGDQDFDASQERSVQDMAREIEERHKMSRRRVDRSVLDRSSRHVAEEDEDAPGGPEVYTAVSQQSLVPSVSDPSLWMVSCSNGKEQDMVFQIMNKCVAFARQGRPLGICGAIAAKTKGKIYIESYSEPAVVEAIGGTRGLLQYTMRLVPIQDMTTIMTVVPSKKPGTFNWFLLPTQNYWFVTHFVCTPQCKRMNGSE